MNTSYTLSGVTLSRHAWTGGTPPPDTRDMSPTFRAMFNRLRLILYHEELSVSTRFAGACNRMSRDILYNRASFDAWATLRNHGRFTDSPTHGDLLDCGHLLNMPERLQPGYCGWTGYGRDREDKYTCADCCREREINEWKSQPDRYLAYYTFPKGTNPRVSRFAELRQRPYEIHIGGEALEDDARVSTWIGTPLGAIVSAKVYRHNFGSRMVFIRVRGNNGANYYGRASWDNGNCIYLRRAKESK